MRRMLALIALLLATLSPALARADVVVTFYSHDMEGLGMRAFPHALVTVKGHLARGGPAIDTNYGYTPVSVDSAILMGSVRGLIETKDAPYMARSRRHFSVTVSDATYDRLVALVQAWGNRGPKGYNLSRANCVHFAGAVAELVGLKVAYPKALIKKPKAFLDMIYHDNAATFASRAGQ
jgi:hypothetical protein